MAAPADVVTPWLTPRQAAVRAQVGVRLVYREIRQGRLRAARIGMRRDLRVHVTWVDEWLERCSQPVELRSIAGGRR